MEHDCHFQNEIINLLKESGKQTALLEKISESQDKLEKKFDGQEEKLSELKTFKTEFNSGFKTTIAVTGFFLTVITSGITFIINYLFKN